MSDCETNILPDSPASSDAFGSHEPISRALTEMIVGDRGGRSVALEGRWGSGKSSIIRFLREELNQRDPGRYGVFLFDAWAHRGDPLRRSFLEELVAYFRDKGWAEEDAWSDELKKLSGRKKTYEIEREPVLKRAGKIVAITLLLAPVGYAVASGAFDWFGFSWSTFLVGVGLTLLPAITALIILPMLPNSILGEEDANGDESHLSLFVNQTEERIERTEFRTPDPTSIEFHQMFQRVLTEVLGQEERTLVIAVDNLDRVEADEALDIWSTMRTFFEFRQMGGSGWSEQLWLIVPFDRSGLKSLWSEEIADGSDELGVSSRERAVDAFLEKSFQVRYHVPPPVTSGWRKYFRDKLGKALPEHQDPDERYRISRIYEIDRQEGGHDITPRDVKLFINELGALHRQWCGVVPLTLQALYLTYKDAINANVDVLEDAELVDEEVQRLVGVEDWQRYLAALHYNVMPSKAMQVWMGGKLEEVIVAKDEDSKDELINLSETPGFGQVCERIIEERSREWVRSEPASLTAVAKNIDRLSEGLGSKPREERLWQVIKESCLEVEEWPNVDFEVAQGLTAVLQHTPAEEYVETGKRFLSTVRDSLKIGGEENGGNGAGWISAYTYLVQHLKSGGIEVETVAYVPGDPSAFLQLIRLLDRQEYSNIPADNFKPEGPWRPVIARFSEDIHEHGLGTADIGVLEHFINWRVSEGWDEVNAGLQSRLEHGTTVDGDELSRVFEAFLMLVACQAVARSDLEEVLSRPSHLGHRLQQLHQQEKSQQSGVAAAVLLMLLMNPEGSVERHIGQSSSGLQFYNDILQEPKKHGDIVSTIASLIQNYDLIGRLLADASVTRLPIIYEVLKHYTEQGTAGQVVEPIMVYEKWDMLRDGLGQEMFRAFLEQVASDTNVVEYVSSQQFDRLDSRSYRELLDVVASSGKVPESFQRFLFNGLSALDADEWESALREERAEVSLARRLLPAVDDKSLGEEFRLAIGEYREAVASGEIEAGTSAIGELLEFVDPDQRTVFIKNTIDELIYEAEDCDGVLSLFGNYLFDEMEYVRSQADQVVRRLLKRIVEGGGETSLKWMIRLLDKEPTLLEEVGAGTREDFLDRLERKVVSSPEESADGEEAEDARVDLLKQVYSAVGDDGELLVEEDRNGGVG